MGSHRELIERLFDEVWNGRQFDKIDELYAPDFIADYRAFSQRRVGSVACDWPPRRVRGDDSLHLRP